MPRIYFHNNTTTILSNQNGLISGRVDWLEDLDFRVSDLTYSLDNNIYNVNALNITLQPADLTLSRIDVFIADIQGSVSILEGIPSANPIKPEINPLTQIELTFVLIEANSTQPQGVSLESVYTENEGAPNEWNTAASSGAIDFNNTTDPATDINAIAIQNYSNFDTLSFTKDSLVNTTSFNYLRFKIKNSLSQIGFLIQMYNGNTLVSGEYSVIFKDDTYNYTSQNTTEYQNVFIPKEDFQFTNTEFDRIDFKLLEVISSPSNSLHYIDDITIGFGMSDNINADHFIDLSDTPNSYEGQAGKIPSVNEDENAIIFIDLPTGGSNSNNPVEYIQQDNVALVTNNILTSPINHFFSGNETKVYLGGPTLDTLVEYPLTSPGQINVVGVPNTYDFSSVESGLLGGYMSKDGTILLVAGSNNGQHKIQLCNLTLPNSLSGGYILDPNFLETSNEILSPRCIALNKDKTRLYVSSGINMVIIQYNLPNTGSLVGATFAKQKDFSSFFVGSTGIDGISLSEDETTLLVGALNSQDIVTFLFGSHGEIDSLVSNGRAIIDVDTNPFSTFFTKSGFTLSVNGFTNKELLQLTLAEQNTISALPDISDKEVVIVIDGDSLTQGTNNAGEENEQYWPTQVANSLTPRTSSFTIYSLGVSGASLQQKMVDVSTRVYPLAEAGKENILIAWLEANSILQILSASDGSTPDNSAKVNEVTQLADYDTYFNGATDFQKKVLIIGYLPRVNTQGDYTITLGSGVTYTIDPASVDTLETFHNNVRARALSASSYNYVFDLSNLELIGGPKGQIIDLTHFADYLHLQTAGQDEIIEAITPFIHAIIAA